MSAVLNLILLIVLTGLVSGFVIWIVSKLGMGLEVDGFGSAFGAAIVIAFVGGIIQWLIGLVWTLPSGWLGAVIHLIVAAGVLMISDRILKGMRISGFVGAMVAAIAISVVNAILAWLLGLLV